jgi:hypothetical protein
MHSFTSCCMVIQQLGISRTTYCCIICNLKQTFENIVVEVCRFWYYNATTRNRVVKDSWGEEAWHKIKKYQSIPLNTVYKNRFQNSNSSSSASISFLIPKNCSNSAILCKKENKKRKFYSTKGSVSIIERSVINPQNAQYRTHGRDLISNKYLVSNTSPLALDIVNAREFFSKRFFGRLKQNVKSKKKIM